LFALAAFHFSFVRTVFAIINLQVRGASFSRSSAKAEERSENYHRAKKKWPAVLKTQADEVCFVRSSLRAG
jgi:hypothetical protein